MMVDNGIRYLHMRTIEQAGVKRITLHETRHTCASLLSEQGVPLIVVSELLGHKGITITADTYTHPSLAMQVDAVTALEKALSATTFDPQKANSGR